MKKSELSSLRVKMKSLAQESRIIRHEMRRHQRRYRELVELHPEGKFNAVLRRIPPLHWHRVDHVRPCARTAHLAYACLRELPYAQVEAYCRPTKQPDWDAIRKEAKRFRPCRYRGVLSDEDIDAWIEEGKAHALKAQSEKAAVKVVEAPAA